ncbi:MAG: nucleoside recognition domain-containing protein, partial [Alloprevotella sp.]|nr:nucleoside recognition domain-containing protein [Alloprevotella sp.]
PPYRRPVIGSVLRHTWEKGREYLRKMGGVILIASITVWALGYFPVPEGEVTPAERQEQSYLGRIGHTIEPAIAPMGYDWRMGMGILSGIGAKELMVTTLAVLYTTESEAEAIGTDDEEAATRSLGTAMRRSGISWQSALSFLVFALLYFPCTATIAAIRSESGRWKYAIFTAVYTTALAYIMALLTYRIAMAL